MTCQASTINTTAAPTTTVAETNGDISYSQQDSVEDYQKAYAEFLNSIEYSYSANIIHINEDDVPELCVTDGMIQYWLNNRIGKMFYMQNLNFDSSGFVFCYKNFI